jgi:hypothetical protein
MSQPISFPSASVRHGLPYLFAGQAQKEYFVNEAIARIDSLLHPVVLDRIAQPPAAPEDGASYIIAQNASGEWAGHEDCLAVWQGDEWLIIEPKEGLRVDDRSRGQMVTYRGGWTAPETPATPQGGATIDIEARAAIAAIVDALKSQGQLPQS